jgi:uncharacterized membrane protein
MFANNNYLYLNKLPTNINKEVENMSEWYGCKLWIGLLFLVMGVFFLLRDYGFLNFKLEPLTAVLVVVGVAFLFCPRKKPKQNI